MGKAQIEKPRSARSTGSWGRRAVGSALAIGFAIAAIPVAAACADTAETLSSPLLALGTSWLSTGETQVDELLSQYGLGSIDQTFAEEAVDLTAFGDAIATDDGSVLGCTCEGDAAEVFGMLCTALAEKGWVLASSGSDVCGTLIKNGGRYRWLYVSCSSCGDATSVVFQCQRKDGS